MIEVITGRPGRGMSYAAAAAVLAHLGPIETNLVLILERPSRRCASNAGEVQTSGLRQFEPGGSGAHKPTICAPVVADLGTRRGAPPLGGLLGIARASDTLETTQWAVGSFHRLGIFAGTVGVPPRRGVGVGLALAPASSLSPAGRGSPIGVAEFGPVNREAPPGAVQCQIPGGNPNIKA